MRYRLSLFKKENHVNSRKQNNLDRRAKQQCCRFFRTHAEKLAEFFVSQGIDKKTLRDALEEKKASDYVKQALDAMDVKEEITEKKDEKRTLDHMARLSRALRVAARERGALGDFKDVFAQDK